LKIENPNFIFYFSTPLPAKWNYYQDAGKISIDLFLWCDVYLESWDDHHSIFFAAKFWKFWRKSLFMWQSSDYWSIYDATGSASVMEKYESQMIRDREREKKVKIPAIIIQLWFRHGDWEMKNSTTLILWTIFYKVSSYLTNCLKGLNLVTPPPPV